jgi:hypothetical protein
MLKMAGHTRLEPKNEVKVNKDKFYFTITTNRLKKVDIYLLPKSLFLYIDMVITFNINVTEIKTPEI